MLSEEEKKAIKTMEIIVGECKLENKRKGYEGTYYDGDTPIPYKQYETILNLVTRLQKENDILKNHIHYKKCQNCGKEYRTKRSDSKYCNECAKTVNNKNWYRNLTEEQKRKRREQSKKYMRKIRKERKDDRRRKENY